MHLGQNRTSFLNGLDSIKDIPNLTIVGTTNINPNSANLDQATLSRLGNIFEIKRPTAKEIVASLKFHLGKKSKATGDLIKNDAELQKLAEQIEAKAGAQRDVEFLVKDSLLDFTRDIEGKADAKSTQMTADYIEKAINKKETWAAGIETGTTPTGSIPQVPNSLMDEFWKFIARRKGAM
jgi:SpoVK/Ycf46/Vps4 family AAA+-type ATPase